MMPPVPDSITIAECCNRMIAGSSSYSNLHPGFSNNKTEAVLVAITLPSNLQASVCTPHCLRIDPGQIPVKVAALHAQYMAR